MRRLGGLVLIMMLMGGMSSAAAEDQTLNFGRLGKVTLYRQSPHPSHVILLVSGDGGWNQGVVDMARELAGMDALVAGINIVPFLRQLAAGNEACSYPAADFEDFSHFIQKSLGYASYTRPVLMGYSSGATLVYAILAQAPPGTFLGGVSLGFCPDLPLSRPFCRGSGLGMKKGAGGKGIVFLPAAHLKDSWITLQGDEDKVCYPGATQAFVREVANGEIFMLPRVGHGFSVPRNWMPQFKQAFTRLTERQAAEQQPVNLDLKDLPLVELPAAGTSSPLLVVLVSGDGGWAGIDQEIASALAAAGVGVVGLNSLKYFWTSRTPEGASRDLGRILTHYLATWQKTDALLVGYSLGADVLPFMAAGLPEDLRLRVRALALLGPGKSTAFEFHVSDWIGGGSQARQYPLRPEIGKLGAMPVLCFYGQEESESLCREDLPASVTPIALGGGHHFGGRYDVIVDRILKTHP